MKMMEKIFNSFKEKIEDSFFDSFKEKISDFHYTWNYTSNRWEIYDKFSASVLISAVFVCGKVLVEYIGIRDGKVMKVNFLMNGKILDVDAHWMSNNIEFNGDGWNTDIDTVNGTEKFMKFCQIFKPMYLQIVVKKRKNKSVEISFNIEGDS